MLTVLIPEGRKGALRQQGGQGMMVKKLASVLACGVCIVAVVPPASAQTHTYNIPAGSLKSALDTYSKQSGRPVIYQACLLYTSPSPRD